MPIDIAGGGAPIANRANIIIDRVNGDATRFVWRGIYADLQSVMSAQSLDLTVTQMTLDPDTDGPLGTLTVIRSQSFDDGTPEVPLDTLELVWFRREKSIWFAPALTVLNYNDRGKVLSAIKKFETDGTMPAFNSTVGDVEFVSNVAMANEAFGILAVQDTYAEQTATITWTRTVSQQFATQVGLANMNKIWLTATLNTYLNSAGVIPIHFSLAAITPPVGIIGTAYTRGWMKVEADANIGAIGKSVLREVWEYGAYNNTMYAIV